LCTETFRRPLRIACIAGSLAFAGLPAPAWAKVYFARDEALELAFPGADRVEARDVVLTDEQHERVQKLAGAALDTRLITVYVGWRGQEASAYAIFDTHNVRTFPETFLVVISPVGTVRSAHILAFHEPEEYLPSARWLEKFKGSKLGDDLKVGSGVVAITGSTLSTRAVTAGIRRALAIWNVVIGGK